MYSVYLCRYCVFLESVNVIEFENAAYTVDEIPGGTQVEIGVRLVTIGSEQMGPTGNLAEVIRARISTSDITAVALGPSKNQGRFD